MVATLTKANVKGIVEEATKPVVIDVYATWCGPCQYMKPIFEQLAKELSDTYSFAQLNVDEARELAISYGISSVPTFVFIKDNQIKGKVTGALSKEELVAKIKEYLG